MSPCGTGLVVASRSPQRRAILESLGVPFVVRPSDYHEVERAPAAEIALANALGKARAVARSEGETVLGVDTMVELDGRVWGKPADAAAARETLRALSGRTHAVVSGVALVGETTRTAMCSTAVTFRELDAATVDWYVATGEWRERAGGYAIQGAGAALVAAIDGDWTNVVGLPVGTLLALEPALLTGCNNAFTGSDPVKLQP